MSLFNSNLIATFILAVARSLASAVLVSFQDFGMVHAGLGMGLVLVCMKNLLLCYTVFTFTIKLLDCELGYT